MKRNNPLEQFSALLNNNEKSDVEQLLDELHKEAVSKNIEKINADSTPDQIMLTTACSTKLTQKIPAPELIRLQKENLFDRLSVIMEGMLYTPMSIRSKKSPVDLFYFLRQEGLLNTMLRAQLYESTLSNGDNLLCEFFIYRLDSSLILTGTFIFKLVEKAPSDPPGVVKRAQASMQPLRQKSILQNFYFDMQKTEIGLITDGVVY